VGGLIVDMRRRGNRVTLVLDDRTGRLEVTLFDETYQQCRHVVAKDAIVVVEGGLRFDDFIDDWRVTAKRVVDLDRAMQDRGRRLLIRWKGQGNGHFVDDLQRALEPHREGECSVAVVYRREDAAARILLGPGWRIRPSVDLLHRLGSLVGPENVRIEYAIPLEP
jgi:DNA polymerase-3 subunit alpha